MKSERVDDQFGVYQEEVLHFVKACNDYIAWINGAPAEADRFLAEGTRLLSRIYYLALAIEDRETVYEEGIERETSEQEWAAVYHLTSRVLGPSNSYLRMAEEGEFDRTDLVPHTIAEDLADIFQELNDFIAVYSSGTDELMNDALWQVREAFYEHWGKKVLLSLTAMHNAMLGGVEHDHIHGDDNHHDHSDDTRHGFFSRFQDQSEEDY